MVVGSSVFAQKMRWCLSGFPAKTAHKNKSKRRQSANKERRCPIIKAMRIRSSKSIEEVSVLITIMTILAASSASSAFAFPARRASTTVASRTSNYHHRYHPSIISTATRAAHRLTVNSKPRYRYYHSSSTSLVSQSTNVNNADNEKRKAYLAVGSNMGNTYQNIATALSSLQSNGSIQLLSTSFLRTTAPMYFTNQPNFLNGAVQIETSLPPLELLAAIKHVENELGRDVSGNSQRYGPRPVDLDILLYDGYDVTTSDGRAAETIGENDLVPNSLVMNSKNDTILEIPHPRMAEREFVLAPMMDLEMIHGSVSGSNNDEIIHPILNKSMKELLMILLNKSNSNNDDNVEEQPAHRILPLPRNRMLIFNETIIQGILNVTPDSFSDGGKYSNSVQDALDVALQMEKDGAGIIDIGGESTRPGAEAVGIEEELRRVLPIIERIREESDIPISIDTRNARVAQAAIEAGADIVNDVSGGTHDPEMLSCVASMGVPIILMHMRGNPKTMQALTNYTKNAGVLSGVVNELMERSNAAEAAGIPRWLQVLDPGIGFAKDIDGNLSLLKGAGVLRANCANMPFLFGPSRKGFIGKVTGEVDPAERDFGTIAACLVSIENKEGIRDACNILRVHNVKAVKQAVLTYEAIQQAELE